MKTADRLRVPPEQLRWTLAATDLGFETTSEVASRGFSPGQHRAVRALEIGLALRGHGYNVFVAGEPGTTRTETVSHLLDHFQDPRFQAEDFCFVNNFRDADQPRLLRFTAGLGRRFRDSMRDAVDRLREGIPQIFQSQVYVKRRRARMKRISTRVEELAATLREQAEPLGLVLVQLEIGDRAEAELLPLVDGEPVAFEDLEGLTDEGKFPREEVQRLRSARHQLEDRLQVFRESASRLVAQAEADLTALDKEMTRPFLNLVLSRVYKDFQETPGIPDYLREVESFMESRMALFHGEEEDDEDENGETTEAAEALRKLGVNLILDHAEQQRPPILFEHTPSLTNLRGTVDRDLRANGMVVSDFTHIKPGSLIRAHRGFLVLHADDFDSRGRSWNLVKRTLRTGQVQIEAEPGDAAGSHRALRPQPVPVDVKVILIGTATLYQTLLDNDPDFQKLFKIKAEFDTEMELGPQAITEYACLVRSVCDEDHLPAFHAGGVAAVVEYGVRLAGQRNRITTRFSEVADLVRESAFWARQRSDTPIQAEDVHRALDERRTRVNLSEEKTQRLIREGVILIDTEGDMVGQINGLAVLDLGDHQFGRPTRITASVAAGMSGVINIERHAELSGRYHDKGVLILTGFLMETFAADRPLAVSASITLEQSYDEVDGDSASTAEICALLSALSGTGVRQDLSVTGSMNQKGKIQAVGGVNEKVEGFYDLCAARGLTGTQGVILPAANLPHLMLRPAVVQAVQTGRFHIYAVHRVEEAAELLMGLPCGERDPRGQFARDTLFGRVQRRLDDLANVSRDFLPWRNPAES